MHWILLTNGPSSQRAGEQGGFTESSHRMVSSGRVGENVLRPETLADAALLHIEVSATPTDPDEGARQLLSDLLKQAQQHQITTSLEVTIHQDWTATAAQEWLRFLSDVAPATDVVTARSAIQDPTEAEPADVFDPHGAPSVAARLIEQGAAFSLVASPRHGLTLNAGSAQRLTSAGKAAQGIPRSWADFTGHLSDLRLFETSALSDITTDVPAIGHGLAAGLLRALLSRSAPEDVLGAVDVPVSTAREGKNATLATEPAHGVKPEPSVAPDPVEITANQPEKRFYRGGAKIDQFRGVPVSDDYRPEDWIASTVSVSGEDPKGQTVFSDTGSLRAQIHAQPEAWLGRDHVVQYGIDPMILVKLLHAGQRLPVHFHPSADFMKEHRGTAHGKAEAWYILEPGVVYLGLKQTVSEAHLLALLRGQKTRELLDLLHEIAVDAGDMVYVPPGILHAIGEGVFLVEVQEPEDLSVLLEWKGFAIDGEQHGHLGLGFETVIHAATTEKLSPAGLEALLSRGSSSRTLPQAAQEHFRLQRHSVSTWTTLDQCYSIIIGIDGALRLTWANGASAQLRRGTVYLVPLSAGETAVSGSGDFIRVQPPALA